MADDAPTIRLVTWNVHGCVGADGRFDPERTADVLAPLDADIFALQEVDSRHGLDTFEFLRRSLGGHFAEARSITTPDGDYGQIVISRRPLRRPRIHDLSVPGREARRAIEVGVDLPGGRLRLVATHLGLGRSERRVQLGRLREIAGRNGRPTVLLGDFNDWRLRGDAHRAFASLFEERTNHRTYPARFPLLPLDRVWCRPAALLRRSWTIPEARHASDHLPVVTDLTPSGILRAPAATLYGDGDCVNYPAARHAPETDHPSFPAETSKQAANR